MKKIGIIGAGAWGTALANIIRRSENEVVIWAREHEVVTAINETHENPYFLKDIKLDKEIRATNSLSEVTDADILFLVTPAQHVRKSLQALEALPPEKPLVICSKGVELETGNLMTQIAQEELPGSKVGVMTGPTFAEELGRGLPSAVTLAFSDKDTAQFIIDTVASKTFRLYHNEDVIGAQIGGAVKNIIAIACGAAYGMRLGESARAALMTRGLAEMARLASAMGASRTTLLGMCGVGDLMLTCNSMKSRNFSLGAALGEGRTLDEILTEREGKAVTEGVDTARAVKVMIDAQAVSMPISEIVFEVLTQSLPIRDALDKLLERPLEQTKD